MADEPTTPAETPPAEPQERTVPYDRFKSVNDQAKQAKQQADELRQRLEELEAKDQSELERERKAREKAEARAAELESGVKQRDRADLLRAAARDAKFEDPDDAVVYLGSQEVADAAEAKRLVKDLAGRKKNLLRNEGEKPPAEIGQVVTNGKPSGDTPPQVSAEQAARLREAQAVKGAIDALKNPQPA
jgi:uncharacterized protein YbjT (DUF2867 family)